VPLDSAVLRMDIVALVPGFAPRPPRLLPLPLPLLPLHLLPLRLRQALGRLISGISVADRGGAVGPCVLLLMFARIIVFGTLSASEGAPMVEYMGKSSVGAIAQEIMLVAMECTIWGDSQIDILTLSLNIGCFLAKRSFDFAGS
jgi:hypothetical protein